MNNNIFKSCKISSDGVGDTKFSDFPPNLNFFIYAYRYIRKRKMWNFSFAAKTYQNQPIFIV